MGVDKAALVVDGEPLARHIGALLAEVAQPALEVGPGWSGLPVASVPDPGEGPLPAIVAGWLSLEALGHTGSVIVLATDLPWLTHDVLEWLAGASSPGPGADAGPSPSVVPVVAGHPQPLCARWCRADLERAAHLAAQGERTVRAALGPGTAYLDETAWGSVAPPEAFIDVDRPEDLERYSP